MPARRGGASRGRAALAAAALLPALAAQAADWTAEAGTLAPALRACLAGDAAAFVTEAMPAVDGRVLVRLRRGGDGPAEDCLATPGGEVLAREAIRAAPPPDPAAPAFFLERRCVDARRVDGPDGAVLGWLAYPGC